MITGQIIVDADATREEWITARSEGVTASEAHAIATGGRKAWAKILDDKLNGSTFRGNKHTRRGNEREAILIDFAATIDPSIQPNSALWADAHDTRFRATPDGIGDDVVAEVKSHAHGHDLGMIPPEHRSQMQWQMLITGASRALYVREVMDKDGQGPLDDPDWQWVDRDEEHIAWLQDRALAFLAWWDADCPEYDDLDTATATALARWIDAKRDLDPITTIEKTAKAELTKLLKQRSHSQFGVQVQGGTGGAVLTAASWRRVLDESKIRNDQKAKLHALRKKAETAQSAVEAYEEELRIEFGIDCMVGTQSLRLAGSAR